MNIFFDDMFSKTNYYPFEKFTYTLFKINKYFIVGMNQYTL